MTKLRILWERKSKKKLFALQTLEKSGLLAHLIGLPNAQTIILFGSLSRWDWYQKSDIDLFVYGDVKGFDQGTFRAKLHREIQVFACENKADLKKYSPELLRNIVKGYVIKGGIDFVKVEYA